MNHKKITVAGLTIVALFSFSILKPMERQDPNSLETLAVFETNYHLGRVCYLHDEISKVDMSTGKRMGKAVKPVLEWLVPSFTAGWSLKNLSQEDGWKNWRSYIVPGGIGLASGLYSLTLKKTYENVIKTWDEEMKNSLHLKQKKLEPELKKINSERKTTDSYNNDHYSTFDYLAILITLKEQADGCKNFEPTDNIDLREIYKTKEKLVIRLLKKEFSGWNTKKSLNGRTLAAARKNIETAAEKYFNLLNQSK